MNFLLSHCNFFFVIFEMIILLGIINHDVILINFDLFEIWPYFLDILNRWRVEHLGDEFILCHHLEIVEVLDRVAFELWVEHLHRVDPAWILQDLFRLPSLFEMFRPKINIHQLLVSELSSPQIAAQSSQVRLPKRRLLEYDFISVIIHPNYNSEVSKMLTMKTNDLITNGMVLRSLREIEEAFSGQIERVEEIRVNNDFLLLCNFSLLPTGILLLRLEVLLKLSNLLIGNLLWINRGQWHMHLLILNQPKINLHKTLGRLLMLNLTQPIISINILRLDLFSPINRLLIRLSLLNKFIMSCCD